MAKNKAATKAATKKAQAKKKKPAKKTPTLHLALAVDLLQDAEDVLGSVECVVMELECAAQALGELEQPLKGLIVALEELDLARIKTAAAKLREVSMDGKVARAIRDHNEVDSSDLAELLSRL